MWPAAQRIATADSATTIHVRNDRALVTDGPFVQTKAALGGFYLIERAASDAAPAWAAPAPRASSAARPGRASGRGV